MSKSSLSICICIALLTVAITTVCHILVHVLDDDLPLLISFGATTVILFFGFLILARADSEGPLLSESAMRTAVAGTMVLEYLLLVGTVAFFNVKSGESAPPLNPLTQMMISSFTTVVGVVIAFYFGGSTLTQMRGQIRAQSIAETKPEEKIVRNG